MGGVQVALRIDGEVFLGQCMRSIRMNSPAGAGSQFDSLSLPGDSCWKYSVIDQKPLTGGFCPFAKVSKDLLAPVSLAPVLSTSV